MTAFKRHFSRDIYRVIVFIYALSVSASHAEMPERISPFLITENGWFIENVDFGKVPPSSFHQRFIVITNTSSHVLKKVALKITGNYKVSNCMSEFQPATACRVVLNYKAPAQPGWEIKWLNIEFTVQQADGSVHADSQQLQIIGGVKPPANPPE